MNRILVTLAIGTGIGAAIGAATTFTLVTERSTDRYTKHRLRV
jgi:hypothetical protein